MDETLKLPATVTFLNADGLEASGDGDKIESFRIIANSGSRMSFWHGDVVIDMNGIRAIDASPLSSRATSSCAT